MIRAVTSDQVLSAFDRDHPTKPDGSNEYARGLLIKADQQFGGTWTQVSLSQKDICGIILPPHRHGTELIPISGMTVSAAVEKVKRAKDYQSANPCCWKVIAHWMELYPSPVFLSIAPVTNCTDHQYLTGYQGHLIHLDGLHRLIAWGLSGKLDPATYKNGVGAYVAGMEAAPDALEPGCPRR